MKYELFKVSRLVVARLSPGDHMDEIMGENEWYSFSLHSKFALEIAQKMSKVDMKELLENKSMLNLIISFLY